MAAQRDTRDDTWPPGSIEVVLVRHGATVAAQDGEDVELLEGQADPPLAPAGERQARAVAERLAGEALAALYVTPLRRTAQTAAPLAAATGLEPIVVPELREVHLGELDGGRFRQAVVRRDPLTFEVFREQRWDVIPGAESMAGFAARTRTGFERVIAGLTAGERVAAIVHAGVIGELCRQACGCHALAFAHADNGSLTRIRVLPDGGMLVRRFNDDAHLRG